MSSTIPNPRATQKRQVTQISGNLFDEFLSWAEKFSGGIGNLTVSVSAIPQWKSWRV
jgi:hypothetical protein